MAEERASIFEDDEIDVSDFKAKLPAAVIKHPETAAERVRAVSKTVNFRSRDIESFLHRFSNDRWVRYE